MGREYYGGGSSATTWVGGGATAMVNVGQLGMQGPQGMPGPIGVQGQQIIPQQFDEWQIPQVHAVITEEMIEHPHINRFQRMMRRLGF